MQWWQYWDLLIYANFTGYLHNANLYSKENLTYFIRDQIKVPDDFAWHLFLVPNFDHILKFSQMRMKHSPALKIALKAGVAQRSSQWSRLWDTIFSLSQLCVWSPSSSRTTEPYGVMSYRFVEFQANVNYFKVIKKKRCYNISFNWAPKKSVCLVKHLGLIFYL